MTESRSETRAIIGWLAAAAIALAAWIIEQLPFPPFRVDVEDGARSLLSASIIAICLGVIVRNTVGLPADGSVGLRQIVRYIVPLAIVLIGAGLDLGIIIEIGLPVFAVIVCGIGLAMVGAIVLGRIFRLPRRTAILIGIGTAICGTSAVVAAAPLLRANERDLAISITTVNLLGLIVMLLLPLLGGFILLSPHSFGIWAGASIHAVPQAIAAGFSFGDGAGEIATLVKLVRVALLAPAIFILALVVARQVTRRRGATKVRYRRLVPWFIWGFVLLAVANTIARNAGSEGATTALRDAISGIFSILSAAGAHLLTFSMAAIGLDVQLRTLIRTGSRAFFTGAGAAVILVLGSLGLIAWMLGT